MHTDTTADPLPQDTSPDAHSLDDMPVEELAIHTIRTLAMDAVQAAESGHPGTPMALAPIAYLLSRQMRHDPRDPDWFDRDRFVLSAGHASMLQYAMLHLSGYDLPLDEIRDFRQLGSRTPGHPEHGHTPGVETTTGPLGQGLMNAVGMAMAEAHLAAVYNRPEHPIVDHRTYVICSDGDLMEGASHEAASLAGHFGLGKLIVTYDDNRITIDGDTDLAWSDDVPARFEAYGWHVQDLGDAANDLPALAEAFEAARAETSRPSLIVVRSHIGYGSPNKQDTADAHGAPLGAEEVASTKRVYGWPDDAKFLVPERAREHMGEAVARGRALHEQWDDAMARYGREHPEAADALRAAIEGRLPEGWDAELPTFAPSDGSIATRKASGKALQAIARHVPSLMGGSADLAGSNNTLLPFSGAFARGAYENRNVYWGVREHAMCGAANGMSLHGGVRPYVATFLVFTDYARPSIRLGALMEQPVIYVMTHDSIGLGEDGPTHQPIEHLAALRAIPGLTVIRPGDANETTAAWRAAVERTDGPTLMALTRQGLPVLEGTDPAGAARGGYVLVPERGDAPDVVLIGTGSEVAVAVEARALLADRGVDARVVSLPSWEMFRGQDAAYRDDVLPPGVTERVAVEAGIRMGWSEWIGERGAFVGMDSFGASAPAAELFEHFGITAAAVAVAAERLLEA